MVTGNILTVIMKKKIKVVHGLKNSTKSAACAQLKK